VLLQAISFVVGFVRQSVPETFILMGASTALLSLVRTTTSSRNRVSVLSGGVSLQIVLPPWPFLNRHPVTWLKSTKPESKKDI